MTDTTIDGAIEPATVASYLRQHPDFLVAYLRHAHELVLPSQSVNASSLAVHQLRGLREKNAELETRLRELTAVAGDNEKLMRRVHGLMLALLRAGGAGLGPLAACAAVAAGSAAALLGAAMLRYFYVLAEWQARLAAVAHARVEALQARIRPHFLFNSMNTVAALVRVDAAAAERTVEDLSELFRAALGQDDTHSGTLGEELQLVDRYLAIEQLRLGERLRVRRELHDLPLEASMPTLLLQPLVENAVRHGIQPLREGGEIVLRGVREGGAVRIEIDNPLAEAPTIGGSGHGLNNVRQRVAYHFGPRASMEAGPRGTRFIVALRVPVELRHARTDR
jgi:uncharacterized protein YigA (DUF484 family)